MGNHPESEYIDVDDGIYQIGYSRRLDCLESWETCLTLLRYQYKEMFVSK